MTTLKESQYCYSDHILQISKLVKNYFSKKFEIDYYGVYFKNI